MPLCADGRHRHAAAAAPSSDPGKSTLTITGEDLSVLMDVVQNVIPYPNMSDIAKVLLVLLPYAFLGIVPR